MGSPNFRSDTKLDSYAMDDLILDPNDYSCGDTEGEIDWDSFYDDVEPIINSAREKITEWLEDNIPQEILIYEIRYGYHSGFQVIIEQDLDLDGLLTEVNSMNGAYTPRITGIDGYETEWEELPEPLKQVPLQWQDGVWSVDAAVLGAALDELTNTFMLSLARKAREIGMGLIVGKTWTSSVDYKFPIEDENGQCELL